MGRQPIIVGIDPGTTLGYAVLDVSGNVISVHSSRQHDLGWLITRITGFGRAIVIGCDKKNPPSLVEKLSISLGARLISPEDDLLVEDKRELTKGYKTKDSHESDALASALFVYARLRPLLRKIRLYVERN